MNVHHLFRTKFDTKATKGITDRLHRLGLENQRGCLETLSCAAASSGTQRFLLNEE